MKSVRSGLSLVTSHTALLPPFRDPGGILSRTLGMPRRKDGPPSIREAWYIGNVFVNPSSSSSALYRQEWNP